MIRIQIRLTEDDFRQLRRLAEREYRDPKQQAGILIREGLENHGLVASDQQSSQNGKSINQGVNNGQ